MNDASPEPLVVNAVEPSFFVTRQPVILALLALAFTEATFQHRFL